MPIDQTLYNTLLQGIQFRDPRLYDLLKLLIGDVTDLDDVLFPLVPPKGEAEGEQVPTTTPNVEVFSYQINPDSLFLYWNSPDPTRILTYEIREGDSWEFGNRLLVTPSLGADFPPLQKGEYTYWIKAISIEGGYSEFPKRLDVTIPIIGPISITSQVVDNNVLLFWTEPVSEFRIYTYEVFRGDLFLGTATATFKTIFEAAAGTYEYRIRAVDVAGSYSLFSSILVTVSAPSDYLLLDRRKSDLLGERVNVARDPFLPNLLFNVNLTETWEEHFVNNGFNSPQEQIDAGYPRYAQPSVPNGSMAGNGSYEEVIDYELIISGVLVNLDYVREVIIGSGHDLEFTMSNSIVSATGPWLTSVVGTNVFFTQIRWLKIRIVGVALD